MAGYTSRAEDCAEKIKQASARAAKAEAEYSKGRGSLTEYNRALRALADAHNDLYVADGGTIPDDR
jgi:hypothetical protein